MDNCPRTAVPKSSSTGTHSKVRMRVLAAAATAASEGVAFSGDVSGHELEVHTPSW